MVSGRQKKTMSTWSQLQRKRSSVTNQTSHIAYEFVSFTKLDGVGPIDNRPSTDKLHHFVRKKKKKNNNNNNNNLTCDT